MLAKNRSLGKHDILHWGLRRNNEKKFNYIEKENQTFANFTIISNGTTKRSCLVVAEERIECVFIRSITKAYTRSITIWTFVITVATSSIDKGRYNLTIIYERTARIQLTSLKNIFCNKQKDLYFLTHKVFTQRIPEK